MTTNPIKADQEVFSAEMVHLGPQFKDHDSISLATAYKTLAKGVLEPRTVSILATNDSYDLETNGFTFHEVSQPTKSALAVLALNPEEASHRAAVRSEIEKEMVAYAKGQDIAFQQAVCVDSVYRDTSSGPFGAVHLVHIDFPEEDTQANLRGHGEWKDKVVAKLGPMDDKTYEGLAVTKMLNIWMPLDQPLTSEPLAVMDLQSLRTSDVHPYTAARANGKQFPSQGVCHHDSQQWIVKKDMSLGEGIIFDSCRTPHTAVTLPEQGDEPRHSVECRILFLGEHQPEKNSCIK